MWWFTLTSPTESNWVPCVRLLKSGWQANCVGKDATVTITTSFREPAKPYSVQSSGFPPLPLLSSAGADPNRPSQEDSGPSDVVNTATCVRSLVRGVVVGRVTFFAIPRHTAPWLLRILLPTSFSGERKCKRRRQILSGSFGIID